MQFTTEFVPFAENVYIIKYDGQELGAMKNIDGKGDFQPKIYSHLIAGDEARTEILKQCNKLRVDCGYPQITEFAR